MKFKKSMLAICLGISATTMAQKFDNVQKYFVLPPIKWMEAKAEIDKIASNPKYSEKAETQLWKARVYAGIFNDSSLRVQNASALQIATEALVKYGNLDKELKYMKEDAGINTLGFAVIDQIYTTSLQIGLNHFQKKQWTEALDLFMYGAVVGDFITEKNLKNNNQPFDTLSITYAGYAAHNAGKSDLALKYYLKLIDNKVAGKDYLDQYKYVILVYRDKKDETNFNKYIALAKQNYPTENWDEFEIDYINKNYSITQKINYYEQKSSSLTAMQLMIFGDIFTNPSAEEKKELDSAKLVSLKKIGQQAYTKAFEKDNKLSFAAYNAGILLYNDFGQLDDKQRENLRQMQEINAKKNEIKEAAKKQAYDTKNKKTLDSLKAANAALDVELLKHAEEATTWLEKAYESFKLKAKRSGQENQCLRKSVDVLANLYAYRRDKVKVKDPKKFDEYDKLYKQFDAEHDKY